MTDKDKYLLEQCASTRRNLSRPEEEDWEWQRRPIPKNAIAVPEAKTWEERVNARPISLKEAQIEHSLRQNRGRYIAEMRREKPEPVLTEARRNLAIEAFMFIKVKFKDLMKLSGLCSEKEHTECKLEK